MELKLNDFAREVHEKAVAHGWWEKDVSFPEIIAMCHLELSEALEEYRNGREATEIYFGDNGKTEGIPTELADVIIRILDYCGCAGIDIEAVVLEETRIQ